MQKENKFLKMDYYRTYYFTNICSSIIEDVFAYGRTLDDFWGNGKFQWFLHPFQKYSSLHAFIEFCIDRIIYESNEALESLSLNELRNKKFWINDAMDFHGLEYVSFEEWLKLKKKIEFPDDLFYEYLHDLELSDSYQRMKYQMVEETFYILFINRKFLWQFNHEMSGIFKLQETKSSLLKQNGTLKRKSIPKWAERAVFYRDRGKCTVCNKDLTGLLNIANKYNIDHVIPLKLFGLNDISNLQLLCENCNSSKSSKLWKTSTNYENWY